MTRRFASAIGAACSHTISEPRGCITCGDTAVAMRVVEVEGDSGLARCAREDGSEELVETELVGPVRPDDELLVHAATALQRLTGAAAS